MARRATFIHNSRADTIPSITVEAGNFATPLNDSEEAKRHEIMFSFYKNESYDAITLGEAELKRPVEDWITKRDIGFPIVAANLYQGKRSKKPVFEPFRTFERGGVNMAVVGLVTERVAATIKDSTIRVESPFEQQKLMRKLHKRADHITVMGDFTAAEAESLAMAYPFVDLIITSNPLVFRKQTFGKTILAYCGSKGYFGDYLQMKLDRQDSTGVELVRETLDVKIPADTTYESQIARSGIHARK